MKIETLYFEGCPNHKPTIDLIREILDALNIEAEIEEIEVADPAEGRQLHFLGSPTVRINGVDIDPGARDRTDYGFSCRTYEGAGTPPREMIEAAIEGSMQGPEGRDAARRAAPGDFHADD